MKTPEEIRAEEILARARAAREVKTPEEMMAEEVLARGEIAREESEGYSLLTRASQGDWMAQWSLAFDFQYSDRPLAAYFFRKSAMEGGYLPGMILLAEWYRYGVGGIEKSLVEAVHCYRWVIDHYYVDMSRIEADRSLAQQGDVKHFVRRKDLSNFGLSRWYIHTLGVAGDSLLAIGKKLKFPTPEKEPDWVHGSFGFCDENDKIRNRVMEDIAIKIYRDDLKTQGNPPLKWDQ